MLASVSLGANAALTDNGIRLNALTTNALTANGVTLNALTNNALTDNGIKLNGAQPQQGVAPAGNPLAELAAQPLSK